MFWAKSPNSDIFPVGPQAIKLSVNYFVRYTSLLVTDVLLLHSTINRHDLFKVSNGNARTMCQICSKDTIKTYLLLTFNIFHTLFWCSHYSLWTSKCGLGKTSVAESFERKDPTLKGLYHGYDVFLPTFQNFRDRYFSEHPCKVPSDKSISYNVPDQPTSKFINFLCLTIENSFHYIINRKVNKHRYNQDNAYTIFIYYCLVYNIKKDKSHKKIMTIIFFSDPKQKDVFH